MKKRILALLMALCLLAGLIPAVSAEEGIVSGTCGENLTWTLDEEGTLTISGTGDMGDTFEHAPWDDFSSMIDTVQIENGVTSIDYYAFDDYDALTNVTIPDSVTTICQGAFTGCDSLTGIHVDENNPNYSSDEMGVLFDKEKTELIQAPGAISGAYTIPDSVTDIGHSAFKYCDSLTSVTIPDSVTGIQFYAFADCGSLTSVTIPDSVTNIGGYAFENCDSLTSVTIPDSVTIISYSAFYDCDSLSSVTIPDSVTSIGESAFYDCDSLTSVTIPDSVAIISDGAFYDCDSLTSVTIPDSVTIISYSAFYDCDSLSSVTIPDSVWNIRDTAFASCDSLTGIYVDENNSNYSSDEKGVLFNKEKTELIQAPGSISGNYCIPDSVTVIDSSAFADCDSLTGIHVDGNNPNYSSDEMGVLFDKEKTELIQAPGAISGAYTIPDSVTDIGHSAFKYCDSLTSVTIPDSVTDIGGYAFENCDSLTSVTIPDSVTDIGWYAFVDCDSLSSVTILDGVTYIGDSAFEDCDSLSSVTIPGSVYGIGHRAFADCDSLTSVTILDGVRGIGNNQFHYDYHVGVFENCDSLFSVTIPDSVTYIVPYAFADCDNLTGIYVDENNPDYSSDEKGVLFDKEKTELIQAPGAISGAYTIPDSVTDIGHYAFKNCDSLTSVTIPDSVTDIEWDAFADCDSLTSVTIPGSVTDIGSCAFADCGSLTSVTFRGDAPEIDWSAFDGVTATAYYPTDNATWLPRVMRDYSGDITWIPYNPANPFRDVPLDAFYEKPVLWAVENGITKGMTDTTFVPDGACTRGQVVTFLWRAAGCPGADSTSHPFVDVKEGAYYYQAMLWALENGITNGVTPTTFEPDKPCDRGTVVTFLYRAKGKPAFTAAEHPFTDVDSDRFYYNAMLWAVENGIAKGMTATTFVPDGGCTRGQVVTFLCRAYAE